VKHTEVKGVRERGGRAGDVGRIEAEEKTAKSADECAAQDVLIDGQKSIS
jgi:hypothetical protein